FFLAFLHLISPVSLFFQTSQLPSEAECKGSKTFVNRKKKIKLLKLFPFGTVCRSSSPTHLPSAHPLFLRSGVQR
ncbi:hypothetical protein ACQKCH_15630, partial [Nubsella zeaxanthinifaciens]|uniref:hypothetical protein n=1 Tax=Nubsella zeaxanthinifaciens TaxID=392412 RepID=UPI003D0564D8